MNEEGLLKTNLATIFLFQELWRNFQIFSGKKKEVENPFLQKYRWEGLQNLQPMGNLISSLRSF